MGIFHYKLSSQLELNQQSHQIRSSKVCLAEKILPIICYLFAITLFISDISCLDSFPLDDAWIHQVYSRSFAFGHGLAYNEGEQEAGATSPLWVLITAPAHWFEALGMFNITLLVKCIGAGLGLISLLLLQKLTVCLSGSRHAACIAALLFAFEPRLLFSVFSGMETNLLVMLWLSAAYLIVLRKWQWALFFISLTPVTRPEAIILLPVGAGLLLFFGTSITFRKKFILILCMGVPCGLWGVFCYLTNGHWLPNTFYLKAQTMPLFTKRFFLLFRYGLTEHGYASSNFLFFSGLGLFFVICIKYRRVGAFLLLGLVPCVYLLGILSSRFVMLGGFYYWSRWLDPAVLILTAAACIGSGMLLTGLTPDVTGTFLSLPHRYRSVCIICSILIFLGALPEVSTSFQERRQHLASDSRAITLINVNAGRWINQHVAPGERVAVNDAGAIRYFGKRHTVDLLGLNNKQIAFQKETAAEAVDEVNWLAIFPYWFPQLEETIKKEFQPIQIFHIPRSEYTLCNCPGQETKVILKRRNTNNSLTFSPSMQ